MEPKIPVELRDSSVIWVGKRPVRRMPDFLSAFDVALYPFVVNEMTDAVDPLKVWEYFAFGRPVLATPTSLVRENPPLFTTVAPGDEVDTDVLDSAVRAALASGADQPACATRRQAAEARDWGRVADRIHTEITEALSLRGGAK